MASTIICRQTQKTPNCSFRLKVRKLDAQSASKLKLDPGFECLH